MPCPPTAGQSVTFTDNSPGSASSTWTDPGTGGLEAGPFYIGTVTYRATYSPTADEFSLTRMPLHGPMRQQVVPGSAAVCGTPTTVAFDDGTLSY